MDLTTAAYLVIFLLSIAFLYDQVTKRIPSRLDSNQAPKSRFELVPAGANGLPTRKDGFDIIFVHGLGSNPDTTWRATKLAATVDTPEEAATDNAQFVNWVSDFLPIDILEATNTDRDALYTRLANLGNEFLEHINEGIPAQALQPLGSNPLLLANLEYDSISLHDFHKEFMAIAQDDLCVFNFFEKRPTRLLRLWFIQWQQFCVREQSATYEGQNVRNIGLSVDHYGLNKFGSRQDVSYKTILAKLVEVTKSPTRSDKRHYAVPLETVHTYTERAKLSAELEQKLQTRHEKASISYAVALHGLGGAGKSQLALAYAEKHKDRYNPILWIDATDEEAKIMPKGNQGSVIVTSRDNRSVRLVPGTCESVHVDVMSPVEGLKTESALEEIQRNCDKIAQRLGYLALAIDLAGAYIGNDSTPKHALSQYLADYDRHRDELLQMDGFQGLLPTEKTVWTVWDTTLQKIRRKYSHLQPELLLTFLAQFKGSIVQDESFRLACLGMEKVDTELDGEADKVMPACLRQFLPLDKGEWDSFRYRQSCGVLRVEGQWSGVTMHSLVQWRAMQSERDRPWRWWYTTFILAACWSTFGRMYYDEGRWSEAEKLFMQVMETRKTKLGADHPDMLTSMANLASTYRNQGRWEEAEKLYVQVMETSKTKLGADHPDMLTSMANLASTYRNQGRWSEAEKLEVQVMETSKTKLGADHPDTLTSMANLASTYRNQGRWSEAEKLEVQVMETSKTKLGADHPDTLTSMANLASTFWNQGRWSEAEKLDVQVMETSKTKLGADHPDTLNSMANLASTYSNQGRWSEAEKLEVQVMETRKTKLGADHPSTLTSMANLASTYRNQGRWNQGRWLEAEKLEVQVMDTSKTKLGADHPSTLTSMANLASTYRNQGRWSEAEKLDVQVMETRKTKLGADHPSTLTSMANLASTFWNQGRWSEAEKLEVQVMETRKTKLGADHPSTLMSMANLASTYRNQGRWLEAEKLDVQVMETRKTKLGADHPDTLNSMANLASTYSNQGRWSEAEKLFVQVMETRKTKLGADHPDTLTSMANLASTFWNQGRWSEAEKLEVQVMETSKTKLGADHPDTLMSMHNLALTWKDQGRHADALALMEDCLQARRRVLGEEHPYTLFCLSTVAKWSM
ncbi:hypothetical protein B0H66DRAFT_576700 [Apodospora peruviana]|uniref:Kinesin light chain n=1 Tax=Apodospora peruviana TaxID=516989 RepID=A0AAE0I3U6_9PEZI|nr:hypothetical protein B0H66DRAFT_576700 [Apodospora peruviana]